jgi:hypothetical protein
MRLGLIEPTARRVTCAVEMDRLDIAVLHSADFAVVQGP